MHNPSPENSRREAWLQCLIDVGETHSRVANYDFSVVRHDANGLYCISSRTQRIHVNEEKRCLAEYLDYAWLCTNKGEILIHRSWNRLRQLQSPGGSADPLRTRTLDRYLQQLLGGPREVPVQHVDAKLKSAYLHGVLRIECGAIETCSSPEYLCWIAGVRSRQTINQTSVGGTFQEINLARNSLPSRAIGTSALDDCEKTFKNESASFTERRLTTERAATRALVSSSWYDSISLGQIGEHPVSKNPEFLKLFIEATGRVAKYFPRDLHFCEMLKVLCDRKGIAHELAASWAYCYSMLNLRLSTSTAPCVFDLCPTSEALEGSPCAARARSNLIFVADERVLAEREFCFRQARKYMRLALFNKTGTSEIMPRRHIIEHVLKSKCKSNQEPVVNCPLETERGDFYLLEYLRITEFKDDELKKLIEIGERNDWCALDIRRVYLYAQRVGNASLEIASRLLADSTGLNIDAYYALDEKLNY